MFLPATSYKLQAKSGFTLVELLIVIGLVGVLTTITVLALGNARQRTRDAERISAVNQIRVALELGFAQLANYPVQTEGGLRIGGAGGRVLCEVSGLPRFLDSQGECAGTVFMGALPSSPTPADGKCSPAQNVYWYKEGSGGTDFKFEFCLGKAPAQSGLANGLNCATPAGLVPGACK